jgi:HK97 gp10 family phage protein
MSVSIKLEGMGSVQAVFRELADEIGDKKANSKILIPAVREAMKPVLAKAIAEAPEDTGGLKRSLQVEARRPNRKDKRSKYIANTDTVISLVTTASGKKLAKLGIKSDARAMAQEFGTARNPKHPYLRVALESQSQSTVNTLAQILTRRLDQYKKANL